MTSKDLWTTAKHSNFFPTAQEASSFTTISSSWFSDNLTMSNERHIGYIGIEVQGWIFVFCKHYTDFLRIETSKAMELRHVEYKRMITIASAFYHTFFLADGLSGRWKCCAAWMRTFVEMCAYLLKSPRLPNCHALVTSTTFYAYL